MTNESKVYTRFKDRVSRPTDRWDRIENGLAAGTPDVNYCIMGAEGWIEVKAPTEPKREDTPLFASNHPVSIEQINWFHRQAMADGVGWLLIVTKERIMLLKGSTVASLGRKVNELTVAQLRKHAHWKYEHPVPTEAWFDLREILAGVI